MPRSRKLPVTHMSFWLIAHGRQASGQGRRTVATTRSPARTGSPAGAVSTTPRFSWPRIRKPAPGGASP